MTTHRTGPRPRRRGERRVVPARGGTGFELGGVDRVGRQYVPTASRGDGITYLGAEVGNVRMDGPLGLRGCVYAIQRLDQPTDRNRRTGVSQQHGENGPLFEQHSRKYCPFVKRFDRAQDLEVHKGTIRAGFRASGWGVSELVQSPRPRRGHSTPESSGLSSHESFRVDSVQLNDLVIEVEGRSRT